MNDRELLYIKTIADTKSISKAAEELFIAQPSLSQSLQRIERELGTHLFIREQRGMKLTYAGEKYYLMAKEILDIYSDFKSEITHINELKAGRLVIGIARYMGMNILPNVLPDFNKNYPNIEIIIREENTRVLENLVLGGNVDFALTHVHKKEMNEKINYEILKKDEFLLVTPKSYLMNSDKIKVKDGKSYVDLRDLEGEKFILLDINKGIRKVQDRTIKSYGINPEVVFTTKNFETAKRLAANGMGITIIPKDYLNIFSQDKSYDSFNLSGTEENIWYTAILTIPDIYKSQATKVFIDEVKRFFK
ncbi:MAG: LysR family transcriptional regulator [Peptoniphilus grossensis]|uniref:LysR family transcriptional regulator n=1 Tax=Peptoniphilus grossensis TaxID=1465756 RepID=UPI00258B19D5|nr:LysR family transcriptional regulator [Peptoniphilus grossensis]MDU5099343.1 LysR family transcriptional regulator [Peptoniphilus grossensis]